MPTGHYQRKPRVDRIRKDCEYCGKEYYYTPGFLRVHPQRFCSRECMGLSKRLPRVTPFCGYCSKPLNILGCRLKTANYCSKRCCAMARMVEGARWRDQPQIKAYMAVYANRNRARLKITGANWSRRNHSKVLEIKARYRHRNKDKAAVCFRRRHHQIVSGDLTPDQWAQIKRSAEYKCLRCGRHEPDIKLTLDHVVPLSKGGKHTASNVQPLCKSCNSSKSTKSTDYRTMMDAHGWHINEIKKPTSPAGFDDRVQSKRGPK
jgi:5-methylcytosine-specific restriction endonuclease McrA